MLLCLDFKKVDSEKDQVQSRTRGSFGKQICCLDQLKRATAQQTIEKFCADLKAIRERNYMRTLQY